LTVNNRAKEAFQHSFLGEFIMATAGCGLLALAQERRKAAPNEPVMLFFGELGCSSSNVIAAQMAASRQVYLTYREMDLVRESQDGRMRVPDATRDERTAAKAWHNAYWRKLSRLQRQDAMWWPMAIVAAFLIAGVPSLILLFNGINRWW